MRKLVGFRKRDHPVVISISLFRNQRLQEHGSENAILDGGSGHAGGDDDRVVRQAIGSLDPVQFLIFLQTAKTLDSGIRTIPPEGAVQDENHLLRMNSAYPVPQSIITDKAAGIVRRRIGRKDALIQTVHTILRLISQ